MHLLGAAPQSRQELGCGLREGRLCPACSQRKGSPGPRLPHQSVLWSSEGGDPNPVQQLKPGEMGRREHRADACPWLRGLGGKPCPDCETPGAHDPLYPLGASGRGHRWVCYLNRG